MIFLFHPFNYENFTMRNKMGTRDFFEFEIETSRDPKERRERDSNPRYE